MGVPSIDELKTTTCCLSPKIYQPNSEDMDTFIEFPRKKKMFSSSSFYEEPNAIYPTVEEQVELCRKIADSLSDECNLKSKGANMFFKRVKKAEKWIVAESNFSDSQLSETIDSGVIDYSKLPYVRPCSKGLPQLKLILDPRHQVDLKRLLKEGIDIVQHNAVSPEICHDLVKDLNSPTGKGAQLFAKRKKKSVEWVVDAEKVNNLLRERQGDYSSPEPPMEPLMHPRVKMIKAPWDVHVDSVDVAESVIKAAEAKVMTYPAPQVPVIDHMIQAENHQQPSSLVKSHSPTFMSPSQQSDAYKTRLPKGWTSNSTTDVISQLNEVSTLQQETQIFRNSVVSPIKHTLAPSVNPTSRTFSFTNFNATPRAWNPSMPSMFESAHIKPVKPPSVLAQ